MIARRSPGWVSTPPQHWLQGTNQQLRSQLNRHHPLPSEQKLSKQDLIPIQPANLRKKSRLSPSCRPSILISNNPPFAAPSMPPLIPCPIKQLQSRPCSRRERNWPVEDSNRPSSVLIENEKAFQTKPDSSSRFVINSNSKNRYFHLFKKSRIKKTSASTTAHNQAPTPSHPTHKSKTMTYICALEQMLSPRVRDQARKARWVVVLDWVEAAPLQIVHRNRKHKLILNNTILWYRRLLRIKMTIIERILSHKQQRFRYNKIGRIQCLKELIGT